MLVGHITWQGRPSQPSQLQVLPITLTLRSGVTEVNYPAQLTDQAGVFTVTLGALPSGAYNWRVDNSASASHMPNYLANSGTVTISGPITHGEMGMMRAGDASNDNRVNAQDFAIVRNAFGSLPPDPNYDIRADFNGDQAINIADFNMVKD